MDVGPKLQVTLTISRENEEKNISEGKPIPAAISLTALIDTGGSNCVVRKDIPERLGLKPNNIVKVATAQSRDNQCYTYWMRLTIKMDDGTFIYTGSFTAMKLEEPDVSILIGRDLLKNGIFTYAGNANRYTLLLS
jgi:hypothetical protein